VTWQSRAFDATSLVSGSPYALFAFSKPACRRAFVFLVALCLRSHVSVTRPHFDDIFAVRGVPFTDGRQWDYRGNLVHAGRGVARRLRPRLSIALALFYTWFGYSFHTITALNIVVGSLTALFVFLIARSVFNELIAIAAACFFVFDPSQLVQTPQATTEAPGLLFFVAAVYFLLLVDRGGKPSMPSSEEFYSGYTI
jgi:Dolichyl-phosphate-mannose-protein mannosyltransferase